MQRNRPDSTSVSSVLQLTSTFLSSSSWQAGSHGASRSASEPWPGTSGQGSSAMFQPCSEHHTWSSCSFISSAPTQPCTDSFTTTSCQEWLQLQPVWKCHIREILLSFWLFLSCTCSSGNGSSNFETAAQVEQHFLVCWHTSEHLPCALLNWKADKVLFHAIR